MHLYIKNMVCDRCIMVVKQQLENLHIDDYNVSLGEVELKTELTDEQRNELGSNLAATGFELLDDNRQQLVEKIKNTVISQIHHSDEERHHNFSDILSKTLHKDYSYLSKLFSEVEGTTIERFVINHKIEKIKELIIYDEMSLSEIAFKLNYSSVAHLSSQFKKATGLTPSHFREMGEKRKSLDKI